MAKRKGRPKSERDEVTVKMDRSLAAKAKILASHRGMTVGELVTELFGPALDRAYLQMVRELEKRGEKG
jgi:hypothetical protein